MGLAVVIVVLQLVPFLCKFVLLLICVDFSPPLIFSNPLLTEADIQPWPRQEKSQGERFFSKASFLVLLVIHVINGFTTNI